MYSRTRLLINLPMDICFSSIQSFKSSSSRKLRITFFFFPSSAILEYSIRRYIIIFNYDTVVIVVISFLYFYRLSSYDLTSQKHGGAIMNSTGESLATEVREINVVSQPASIELGTHKDKRD